jgi:riboflavin biosynthesis pyrimidine reductase
LLDEGQPLSGDTVTERFYPPPEDGAPLLRVNFVTSIDGAVEVNGATAALSSPADQWVMGLLRRQCDAVLLGAGTLRAEAYGPLTLDEAGRSWRQHQGKPEHPTLVIVSGSLDLDPGSPALREAPARPVVLTHSQAPAARRRALEPVANVLTVGDRTVDLAAAVSQLHDRGLRQILCEGGPHLLGGLTAADLVDELCLTISPVLTGAGAGRITAGRTSPLRRMALRQALAADNFLLLRYRRESPASTPPR